MDEKTAALSLTDVDREELLSRYLSMRFIQLPDDAQHYKCNLCDRLLFINYIASCGHVYCSTCKKVLEDKLNRKCPIPIEKKFGSTFCDTIVDVENWWRDRYSEAKIAFVKSVCLHSNLNKCHRIYPMYRILSHADNECERISTPRFSMPPTIPEISMRNSTVFEWSINNIFERSINNTFEEDSTPINSKNVWKVGDASVSVELQLEAGVFGLIFYNLTSPEIESVMSPAPRVTYTFQKKQNNVSCLSEDEGCVLSDKGSPPAKSSCSVDVVKIVEKRFNERLYIGMKEYEINVNPIAALKNFDCKVKVKIDFSCSGLTLTRGDYRESNLKIIEKQIDFSSENKSKVHFDFYLQKQIGYQSGELIVEMNQEVVLSNDEWLENDSDSSQYFFTHNTGYLMRADFFPGKIILAVVSGPYDNRLSKNPCFLIKTSFYNIHSKTFENFFTKVMWELECQIVYPLNMEIGKYFRMKTCTVHLQVKHLE